MSQFAVNALIDKRARLSSDLIEARKSVTDLQADIKGKAVEAASDTLEEAKKTTIAAQDTVEVTRDIGHAQSRAYVTFKSAKFTVYKTKKFKASNGLFKLSGSAVVENLGQTPATNISYVMKATISKHNAKRNKTEHGLRTNFSTQSVSIGFLQPQKNTDKSNSVIWHDFKNRMKATEVEIEPNVSGLLLRSRAI